MNQIKLKIEEIGLSQREISKRLGKNASYLAGVFRSGLSTAKQAELLKDLEVVGNGWTIMSDEEQIKDLSEQLNKAKEGNAQLRDESDRYFKDLQTAHQSYIEAQNAGIKALESYGIVQNQLTETQKYLMVANQNCEVFETKYRKITLSNWALCIALVVVLILWVVV